MLEEKFPSLVNEIETAGENGNTGETPPLQEGVSTILVQLISKIQSLALVYQVKDMYFN